LSLILALLLKLQSTDKETKIIKATRAAPAMKACTDGIGTDHTIKDLGIMLCGPLRGHMKIMQTKQRIRETKPWVVWLAYFLFVQPQK